MATNFLVHEKIWFDKFKYDDAERRFYEQMNGPVAGASRQENGASVILRDIARARENIQKSLAGVSTRGPRTRGLLLGQVACLIFPDAAGGLASQQSQGGVHGAVLLGRVALWPPGPDCHGQCSYSRVPSVLTSCLPAGGHTGRSCGAGWELSGAIRRVCCGRLL